MGNLPQNQKIYHIVHKDRLSAILQDGCLVSDALIRQRANTLPVIGLDNIKNRRLNELKLNSYPDLFVGQCVPFYFCPRSISIGVYSQIIYDEVRQIMHNLGYQTNLEIRPNWYY